MTLNIATVRREVLWLLIALAVGIVLLPPLVYGIGNRVFGPYAAGSLRELLGRFFHGLGQGEQAVWILALGPYLALLTLRLALGAIRAVRNPA